MAESNATQVILTDDGLKIIKAQSTADSAAGGVTNLNDPNLMSVIEKQNNIAQFAGLTSQYNVLVQNAKDDGIDTTAVTTAYNNLNKFMADALADPDNASDIDRAAYKKYQDAYNEELANIQSAFQNNADNRFASAANATSQAASTASQAFSQAQSVFDYANSEIAVTSTAIDKAQSAADSASSQAIKAIDTGNVTSQAVTDLKDGSTMTIAQLQNGLESKVSNSEYASYKYQTSSQIGEMVTNGAFSAYQKTTADLISSKVATSAFSAYQATTAEAIESKVESSDFTTYKEQTADMFVSKVSFNNLAISNRNLALGTATPFTMNGNNSTNQAQYMYSTSGTIAKGTTVTLTFDITSTNATGTYSIQFVGGTWQSVPWDSPLVSGKQHHSHTFTTTDDFSGGLNLRLDNTTATVTVSNFIISESSKEVSWTPAPEDTQSQITQLADKINFRVTKDGLISQINLQAKNTLISSGGQLTLAGNTIYFDTNNPVIIPSANIETVLVRKQLQAADISANKFSTNNETFTVDENGAITAKNMVLTGGTLTSPTINASTINGSTINGTTFHGGDIISDSNNTAKYYPMTITPDGAYKSTYFDSMVGLQSSVESGAIAYKYRSMIGNGQYLAYDSVINGQGLDLQSGYTSAKDTTFSNPVSTTTGYVIVNANDGITLHGDNQQITFNGTSADVTPKGVIITPYGNINPNGTQNIWYVGNNMNMKTASFGMDGSGTYNIQFNRSLDIGNFNINTYHTFTSTDGAPIHFAKGPGGAADIYAGTVHYDSLVKSSLLSVKKDVQKADTAYWAQLVNSIDLATYQYKSDDSNSHIRLSSIVDDVNDTKQWRLPDIFISRDENGKLNGVDDSVLLNATLATVQEQQKEIDQLNGHNMELEARLNKLEARLNG
ncbi:MULTISPECIES: phage tail protein [Lactiplantibacillus]|uniref:phage tail protein n=1 Tax=Lactiplantibacillus TaxID=2767842 RepID=UPI000FF8EABD|nr:phage tail protein [Lactiplantibacillus plantarum]MBO2722594.1 phage tail protein [Lactiplantibacillus plantarum]MBU7446287.1 phage tail protein [Lactiplantibacillus plantarum]MBU7459021.1 phage tail protein [Lactiplantibacillus plantarum]MBU7466563.1 phage tail protein [Lactiplantibacillus plantarum]MBU8890610.1 phage tail protein [Lactiplantibacillus plantarum]